MARKRWADGPTAEDIADPATAWARGVVDGKIIAGDLTRRACDRHLRDIRDAPRRGLYWRPETARDALEFFPAVLSVTAGAKVGEPFNLPGYTAFVIGSLFGWRRGTGFRRFTSAWLELGKGQIKTPLMAGLGLYIMGYCGIQRSEVYAIAKDRNQANVLFADAAAMVSAPMPGMDGESLISRGEVIARGTGDMTWMIEHPATRSKFRALAGNEAVAGPRPSAVLGDEIHEWKSGAAIETWREALTKMPGDSLMVLGTNTPAADQLVGTEYSERHQKILRREIDDDATFALIGRVDETDDPLNDESCWPKALPMLGLTYPAEKVRDRVNQARHSIATAMSVKRLFFGVPVGTAEYWIDLDAWEAVQGKVDIEALRGRPCRMALDLSQKNDLTALGIGWLADDGKLHAAVRYWKPEEKLADAERADGAPYGQWREAGLLNVVPGRAIEYEFVAAETQRLAIEHDAEMLTFDPAHVSEFRKACDRIGFDTWVWDPDEYEGIGLKMVVHGQGINGMTSTKMLWMPRSLAALEDLVLKERCVVDESPVTKWCAGNAAVKADAKNNRYFVKKRQRGRIDGLTVLAMLAGAFEADIADESSVYDVLGAMDAATGGKPAADNASVYDALAGEAIDYAILNDMRHPRFAEMKALFERKQLMEVDEDF